MNALFGPATLSSGLNRVRNEAFEYCNSLISIGDCTFGHSSVGDGAEIAALARALIPKSAAKLGCFALQEAKWLR